MRVLVHVCCGPCLVYPMQVMRQAGLELRGFFFNPNIHPYSEFKKRLDSLKLYAQSEGLPLIVRPEYPLDDWLRAVTFREAERCRFCYHTRLKAAARAAKKSGYEAYTTTLLFSKFQKHDLIKEIGEALALEAGVKFYYHDFREGWAQGRARAKAAGLYRQNYCGCVYSERDRFLSPAKGRLRSDV